MTLTFVIMTMLYAISNYYLLKEVNGKLDKIITENKEEVKE